MIYLDNAATTKPSLTALEKANVFNTEKFFNPSALYSGGLENQQELAKTRRTILKVLGAVNHELIFTSCGTESDNTAIFGSVKRGSFVTDKGEHSAIYKSFLELKNRGEKVEFIDLNKDGSVNEEKLYEYIKNNRVDFVSIMHVNNETGAINDINKISSKIKSINPKIIFHSDGVQAFGKLNYTMGENVDLYSISAHKINALKGVGALIKKKNLHLSPYIIGGGQEDGLRSGTENVFGIKVFEYATQEHYEKLTENSESVNAIKAAVINGLNKELFTIISGENSSPYILSVSAKGIRGEVLMHSLETEGIFVGNGSACSAKNRFSRVIEACGYGEDVLDGVIRISFDPNNTMEEGLKLVDALNGYAIKLKEIMK